MGAFGLRCAALVAFVSGVALVDCGGTVITRAPEPRDDVDATAGPSLGGAAGAGGASSQLGGANSQFGGAKSQLGGGSGFVAASGGGRGLADASIGGSSGDAADASAGSGGADASRCDCPFGYKCVFTPPVTECVYQCPADLPDLCGSECKNFETDVGSCGACGMDCRVNTREASCEDGKCRAITCEPGFGNCTDATGCETLLETEENCGACGNKMCHYEHTQTACASEVGCSDSTCEPGWGNCDKTVPDCETEIGANGATCFPAYDNSMSVPMPQNGPLYMNGALAGNGTVFMSGVIVGKYDFDPGPGTDVSDLGDRSGSFVTKFGADGKYGWTRVFENEGDAFASAMSAGPDGSVFVSGTYAGSIDFDPGQGVNTHTAQGDKEGFVLKLLADGSLGWVRTFVGPVGSSGMVQLSSANPNGAILVAGTYTGTIDLDPGPAERFVSAPDGGTFVALLTPSGDLAWASGFPGCAQLVQVALEPDATARVGGQFSTECAFDPAGGAKVAPLGLDAFVASFAPSGAYQGVKTFGGVEANVQLASVAAGPDGSTLLGGTFTGTVDFDPGPGKVERFARATTTVVGFLVRMGADGGFAWVHTVPETAMMASAFTPKGGVLAVVDHYNSSENAQRILGFGSDGSSTFSLGFPVMPGVSVVFVAADATGFSVLGLLQGSADLDPGPGTHVVGADGQSFFFTSRYAL